MALKFDDVGGEAKKQKIDYYKFENGENRFRMVGDILPRYVYWKKTPDGSKNMSIECLGFDRDLEKFTNITKDWFAHYFPEDKCSWSYLVQVFDPKDEKLKVLGLKKKLFQQILEMANKHLGDPTNPEIGWEVVVERKKTGALAFNVEYNLDQMSCAKQPLTEEQIASFEEGKTIDELFPVQSPAEQKGFIEKVWFSKAEVKEEEEVDAEATKEFDDSKNDDDIPY